VVGTAAYLAPEQVRGEEATPASDVYALGVVLYQFLTGRLPYEGSSLAELAVRQQNERPLPPRTYNDEVSETLSAAVGRALEGDPERRFISADELADGLRRGQRGEDVTLPLGEEDTPTRHLGGDETVTRRMERQAERTEYRPARPAPARRRAEPPPQPARVAERRRPSPFGRFMRGAFALIALVLIAAAVAAAVIFATDDSAGDRIRDVTGDTIQQVVDEMRQLVRDNTQ
jgi:serine/threonine-protein kinase